jgi:hypothetical protein
MTPTTTQNLDSFLRSVERSLESEVSVESLRVVILGVSQHRAGSDDIRRMRGAEQGVLQQMTEIGCRASLFLTRSVDSSWVTAPAVMLR